MCVRVSVGRGRGGRGRGRRRRRRRRRRRHDGGRDGQRRKGDSGRRVQGAVEGDVVAVGRRRRGNSSSSRRQRRCSTTNPSPSFHRGPLPRPLRPAERHQVHGAHGRRRHAGRQAPPIKRSEHRRGLGSGRGEELERATQGAVGRLLHDLDGVERVEGGELGDLARGAGEGVGDDGGDLEGLFEFRAAVFYLIWIRKRERKKER